MSLLRWVASEANCSDEPSRRLEQFRAMGHRESASATMAGAQFSRARCGVGDVLFVCPVAEYILRSAETQLETNSPAWMSVVGGRYCLCQRR